MGDGCLRRGLRARGVTWLAAVAPTVGLDFQCLAERGDGSSLNPSCVSRLRRVRRCRSSRGGRVAWINESSSAPTHAQQKAPRTCGDIGSRWALEPHGGAPAIEVRRARKRVDEARGHTDSLFGQVLASIGQDIADRVAHLRGRSELLGMIAIDKHLAASIERLVDASRESNRHPLHPARKRPRIVRLHDQVHMVVLHRKVHHAKPKALLRRMNAGMDGAKRRPFAQRQSPRRAHRHVHRRVRAQRRPPPMRHTRPPLLRPPRASAFATPTTVEEEIALLAAAAGCPWFVHELNIALILKRADIGSLFFVVWVAFWDSAPGLHEVTLPKERRGHRRSCLPSQRPQLGLAAACICSPAIPRREESAANARASPLNATRATASSYSEPAQRDPAL